MTQEERARLLTWAGEWRRERPAGAYDYRYDGRPGDDQPDGVLELRVYLGDPVPIVQAVLKAASDRVS